MKLKIEIDLSNNAFVDTEGAEIANILRILATRYEKFGVAFECKLRDTNGNSVGLATVETASK